MRYKSELTATSEPLTLTEVKQHVRALPNDTAEDTNILTPLIKAAREYCENITGRAFAAQTITAYPDGTDGILKLPRPPIAQITSIKYYHSDGTSETLTSSDYALDTYDGLLLLNKENDDPRELNPVEVIYTVGNVTLPSAVRQAMLMLIGHWNQHRESIETGAVTSVEVEMTTRAILNQYKVWWF